MSVSDTSLVLQGVSESEVVFEEVAFSYDSGVRAVEGLTFDVKKGRHVGVIGPSGCGKSTLLFLLAGLYRPASGQIRWGSSSGAGARAAGTFGSKPKLAMVFQKDTLLPWKTVNANIELFAKFQKVTSKREVRERTRELITLASLNGFENSYPYQLSGGMRRRVAFLSAVAPAPEMLLLDEPFSALDEPTRIAIHQDVFHILRRLETTTVIVSHDLAEVISLCDEVIILTNRPGRVHSRHVIPFGDERDMLALRHEREFLELYGRLWEDLSEQIAGPGEA